MENVLFVHDGHCASGWVPPSTSQPSISDCLNECINRGRNVGYIAFRNGTRNTDCACYELSSGCPDDNLWPEHNAYMIVRKGIFISVFKSMKYTSFNLSEFSYRFVQRHCITLFQNFP